MQKKFEINRTKIKGGCQSGRKVVTHNSKRDLTLLSFLSKIQNKQKITNHKRKLGENISNKVKYDIPLELKKIADCT